MLTDPDGIVKISKIEFKYDYIFLDGGLFDKCNIQPCNWRKREPTRHGYELSVVYYQVTLTVTSF